MGPTFLHRLRIQYGRPVGQELLNGEAAQVLYADYGKPVQWICGKGMVLLPTYTSQTEAL